MLAADGPTVRVWSTDDGRAVKLAGHRLAACALARAAVGARFGSTASGR